MTSRMVKKLLQPAEPETIDIRIGDYVAAGEGVETVCVALSDVPGTLQEIAPARGGFVPLKLTSGRRDLAKGDAIHVGQEICIHGTDRDPLLLPVVLIAYGYDRPPSKTGYDGRPTETCPFETRRVDLPNEFHLIPPGSLVLETTCQEFAFRSQSLRIEVPEGQPTGGLTFHGYGFGARAVFAEIDPRKAGMPVEAFLDGVPLAMPTAVCGQTMRALVHNRTSNALYLRIAMASL